MSYIGQIPLPQATEERIEKTATAGQTLFTGLTYVNGHVSVYLNGVKLDNADFTATDGTTVTLGTGAAAGDTVSFVSTTQTSALMSLPLKDSAGTNIVSEASGVVTLGNATLASSVTFPSGHVLQVTANQNNNSFVGSNDTTTIWTDGSSALTVTINCVSANPNFLVIQTAGHSYNHSETLYGASYFRMKCDRDLIIYGSTLSANTYTDKQQFNATNNNSGTFLLNFSSYTSVNHNDSGLKPTSVEYFFSTTNTTANTSFTFTPGSFGNNYHGIHFPSITVIEIKS